MHFHWDIHFSGGRAREEDGGGERLIVAGPGGRVERDDEQASCNGWTFDYGNIECGNEMFIRCVLRERREERGSRGRAGISVNLAAKWRV